MGEIHIGEFCAQAFFLNRRSTYTNFSTRILSSIYIMYVPDQ